MFARRIIPCLDVNRGRVVKGVQFVNLRDAGDPVDCARAYDKEQADELVFLDITASHENRAIVLDMVKRVAASVYIPFTVGGGIRTLEDIRQLLKAGCDKVSLNTIAVQNPNVVSRASARFGKQCIVAAMDVKETKPGVWKVFTHGGRRETAWEARRWARRVERLGAGEILLTSMDRDGTKQGCDLTITRRISKAAGIPVIASGGIGPLKDFYDAFSTGKADAVLAASVFHFGTYSVKSVKRYLKRRHIPVRL